MKRKMKAWLVWAAFLVVLGLVVMAAVMTACGWDLSKLSTQRYETNAHEIGEAFSDISIHAEAADIRFAVSEDGKYKVVCYETEHVRHSVSVQDDTLTIKEINEKNWYDNIGISVETPAITVYLPEGACGALEINESTGDIELPEDFCFDSIDISGSTGHVTLFGVTCQGDVNIHVSTGKTNMTDVNCKNLTLDGSTGDISLKNVIAAETFSVVRTTGNVTFDGCDAPDVTVETDTGDVTGTFRSEKIFLIETDTGDVDIPKSTNGGRCEITTSTGDIILKIQ